MTNGLKDHQIRELVNKVTYDLIKDLTIASLEIKPETLTMHDHPKGTFAKIILPRCFRTMVSEAITTYIYENNLGLDHEKLETID